MPVAPEPPAAGRLLVFARFPRPGQAKTRLIPALGPDGAAALQRRMTEHLLGSWRALLATGIALEVRHDGASDRAMRRWLGPGFRYAAQGEGDLGARLKRAFAEAFQRGAPRVVAAGTDCPALDATRLRVAFAALAKADVVLGPAADGGYYLIGSNRFCPALFDDIPWGTDEVLAATLERIRQNSLTVHLLPELPDVDRPEDLRHWEAVRARATRLAVVIPALNEEEALPATLEAVRRGEPEELIVVDGGSRDGTAAVARAHGARVVPSPPGRARQLNAGAAAASAPRLLFLHADTLPPADWRKVVDRELARPDLAAGAFTFGVREPIPRQRLVEGLVRARCRWFGTPYGDQGLFLRRELFDAAGGFPEWPILEDVGILRRLRRLGRVIVTPETALTSGRRWRQRGVWRTMAINARVLVGWRLGVPLERLARWYRGGPR
ncbi:MAG: DUF2064 domain-containing protein [Verrucomicrobia bacterium]|nr:MAG: DUF2064 domain-containing protein [Verrucomicrobiota bacterium]